MKRSVVLAMIILTIVSLAHLLRVIFGWKWCGRRGGTALDERCRFLFAGGIAAYLWFENRKPA